MAFETTKQEIIKQAIALNTLWKQTRDQKYRDEELRLRRIALELENTVIGGGGSGVTQIVAGTGVTISPAGGTGNVTINATATTPDLQEVTDEGNTTTNAITVGGLTVDTNVLVVDPINDKVGIGTTTPSQSLHVEQGNALIRRTQLATSLFEEGLFLVNPQEPNIYTNTTSPSIVFEGKQKGGAPGSAISKARMAFQPLNGVLSIGGKFEIQTWNGTAWTRLVNFSSDGTFVLPQNPTGLITEFNGSGSSNVGNAQNPSRFVFRPSGPVLGNVGGVTSTLGVNATYSSGNNRGEAAFRVYVTVNGSTNDSLSKFRGVWVDPSISGLAFRDNWRSIEWSNNLGWGLYGVGTANNYLN